MQLQLSLGVADRLHETLLVRGEPLDAVEAVRLLIASPNAPAPICQEILATLVGHDRRFCWDAGMTGLLSLRTWEIPDPDLTDVPFVALDLETTGARAGTEKITEIGAVRFEGLREVRRFNTLVNPMRPIPRMITQITGISQEMVAGAPRIEEVIPELLEFLEGAVVVAHNAPFDVGFLNYELHRLKGRRLGEGAIDTLPLARALAPGLPNYRLHTVAEALGAPVTVSHRALADAEAAGHVFVTLVGRLQEQGITRLGEVRAYVNPSSRSSLEKLHLTRDLPKCPGTYRFVDKDGRILYIGKADRLGERVRSHFVASANHARKVRQAVRMVERIDWDEACTPLEAIVDEQRLILEHRPSCNLHGTRPETYAYIKAGGPGPGLSLFSSGRAPKWLDGSDRPAQTSRQPLTIGPFRGRARLYAALDLLQRCYPIRRCSRPQPGQPCVPLPMSGSLCRRPRNHRQA
jgi:DNA polymerase-3 subunit epsilon